MRKWYLWFILPLLHTSLFAQPSDYCIKGRFGADPYFPESAIETKLNVPYGLADKWFNNAVVPQYNSFDIAYPQSNKDPLVKRPFIILFHGGGFYSGDKSKLENFIIQMAERGYVAASVNYRLGWDAGGADPAACLGDPASLVNAYYTAAQDAQAAIRYFIAHATEYGIDTAMIMAGGQSAGVMGVMTAAFISQQDMDLLFPGESAIYGNLNTADNALTNSFSIKAIVNMWGAISDTNYIAPQERIPVISFYGGRDKIVPPASGPIQDCTEPNTYFTVYGSQSIYARMAHLNGCADLHENQHGTHEAYEDDFTVPNTACFFQKILCGDCASGSFLNDVSSCDMAAPVESFVPDHLKVFPNPAVIAINIELPRDVNVDLSDFSVLDATGKQIPVHPLSDGHLLTINVSQWPAGIYFGNFTADGQQMHFKFVVAGN